MTATPARTGCSCPRCETQKITGSGFACPQCGGRTQVVDSRRIKWGIRRRRECVKCESRFTTTEVRKTG